MPSIKKRLAEFEKLCSITNPRLDEENGSQDEIEKLVRGDGRLRFGRRTAELIVKRRTRRP